MNCRHEQLKTSEVLTEYAYASIILSNMLKVVTVTVPGKTLHVSVFYIYSFTQMSVKHPCFYLSYTYKFSSHEHVIFKDVTNAAFLWFDFLESPNLK